MSAARRSLRIGLYGAAAGAVAVVVGLVISAFDYLGAERAGETPGPAPAVSQILIFGGGVVLSVGLAAAFVTFAIRALDKRS